MKKYLLIIEDEDAWEKFKKAYKKNGWGKNLDEAIMNAITFVLLSGEERK